MRGAWLSLHRRTKLENTIAAAVRREKSESRYDTQRQESRDGNRSLSTSKAKHVEIEIKMDTNQKHRNEMGVGKIDLEKFR